MSSGELETLQRLYTFASPIERVSMRQFFAGLADRDIVEWLEVQREVEHFNVTLSAGPVTEDDQVMLDAMFAWIPFSQRGEPEGVGTLDATGRQPISQSPLSVEKGSARGLIASTGTTLVLAPSNAATQSKLRADAVATGIKDDILFKEMCEALEGTGGTLQILEGTLSCSVNGFVCDGDHITIRGMGKQATTLEPMIGIEPAAILSIGKTRVSQRSGVEHLGIFGRREAGQTKGHGLLFGSKGGRMVDLIVSEAPEDCVHLEPAVAEHIYELFMDDLKLAHAGRYGMYVGENIFNSEFFRVVQEGGKAEASPFGSDGFRILGTNCKFIACHPYKNLGYGARFMHPGSQGRVLEGEYESNTLGGVIFEEHEGGRISVPACYGNEGSDITVSNTNHVHVLDPECESPTTTGESILLFKATKCKVTAGAGRFAAGGAVRIDEGGENQVSGFEADQTAAGAAASIRLDNTEGNDITGCTVDKGIQETGTSNNNNILNNRLTGGVITAIGAATKVKTPSDGVLVELTGEVSVSNSKIETALIEATLAANSARVGTLYRVKIAGNTSCKATSGTLKIRLRLGGVSGTSLHTIEIPTQASAETEKQFNISFDVIVRTIGSGGTVIATGFGYDAMASQQIVGSQGSQAYNTTEAKVLVVTAQWETESAENVCRAETGSIELVRA